MTPRTVARRTPTLSWRPGLAAVLALVLASAVVTLVVAPGACAAERSFGIERFSVAIDVARDGSMQVIETLAVTFVGAHQGLVRTIPLRGGVGDAAWSLSIDDVHVLDEEHRPLQTEITTADGSIQIKAWIPGAADAVRTARIVYRVRHALRAFPDRDELYWNVTGDQWSAWIHDADVTVTLAGGPPAIATRAWTGTAGARGRDYADERDGAQLRFRTGRPLRPHEGLTILVAWPPGTIARAPEWLRLVEEFWPFGLPVLTLLVAGQAWRAHGRDPRLDRSIKPEYGPPAGMSPAEGGTLIDQRADSREVIATLVDLAVRGYLEIEPVDGGKDDFTVRRVKTLWGDRDLSPLEQAILQRIFGEDMTLRERTLSELRQDSHYVLEPIRDEIYRAMIASRLFPTSPFWVREAWTVAGVAVLFVAGGLFLKAESLGPLAWSLSLALGASGAILVVASRFMPRRTARGSRLLLHLRGFREFLQRAEKDRLERLPPDTLDRWLPWAIALGVTQRWIHAFDGVPVQAPAWYTASDVFSLEGLARGLARFELQNTQALLSIGAAAGAGLMGTVAEGIARGTAGGGMGGGGGSTF